MSQDNTVTPGCEPQACSTWWVQRTLSLNRISVLRLQTIQRLFGSARRLNDRCGCETTPRTANFNESTQLWCGLVTNDARQRVRQESLCRLLDRGWLVWQPEPVGFAWAEVFECDAISLLFECDRTQSLPNSIRTLDQWESLGASTFRFRVLSAAQEGLSSETLGLNSNHDSDTASLVNLTLAASEQLTQRLRKVIIGDLFQRNPAFSHVNLTVFQGEPCSLASVWSPNELVTEEFEVEKLRERMVPSWQCGDMAIQRFTTYTITRKDT